MNQLDPTYSSGARDVFATAVAEAERGYDLAFLEERTCASGRPLESGVAAAITVPVRLDATKIAALDAIAARGHETRSDVIRRAIDRELAFA
ncbi:MAG: ribbon-helix-helix protein, CopG family [Propionibacteriaceae bacterium]|jgi:hypothetical protein|nr:ribbon-helix-helix protein, CopG family [Propionibacteriaceae bacterium]